MRTISEGYNCSWRSRVRPNRSRGTIPHSPGRLIPHALPGTIVLASLLFIAGQATAQLTKWDATGLIGVLPPTSLDKAPLVGQIRRSLTAFQVREAGETALALIRQQPGNYEGYFWAGFAEFQRGNYYAAVKHLRQAEMRRPIGNSVQKVLGLTYLELQQDVLFELKMNDAIALDPKDFAPHYSLGRYLQSQKRDSTLAAEEYRLVLERKPGHHEALYYLGLTREEVWDLPEAKSLYERALVAAAHAGATFSLPYQGLSRLARMRGDPASALPNARRAVSLDPKSPENQRELGTVYVNLGRVPEGIAAFKTSIALDPTASSAYYQLASLYRRAGDRPEAEQVLTKFNRVSACYSK